MLSIYGIFFGCQSLKYVDISNLIIENDIELYFDIASDCTIKINQKIIDKIKYPSSCDIIIKND